MTAAVLTPLTVGCVWGRCYLSTWSFSGDFVEHQCSLHIVLVHHKNQDDFEKANIRLSQNTRWFRESQVQSFFYDKQKREALGQVFR